MSPSSWDNQEGAGVAAAGLCWYLLFCNQLHVFGGLHTRVTTENKWLLHRQHVIELSSDFCPLKESAGLVPSDKERNPDNI